MENKGFFKKHLSDIILFFVVAAVAITGIVLFSTSKAGDSLYASVSVKGNIVLKTDLLKENEREVVIKGEHGDLTLMLKKGAIGVKESNCITHYCVNQGFISKPGQTIICAYNAVCITLVSDGSQIIV